MKKVFLARVVCLVLVAVLLLPTLVAGNDEFIQTDPVSNTYTGRAQVDRLISQLQFADLPTSPALQDAIVRSGALGAIRPDSIHFNPTAPITREDAIVMILRAVGLSDGARAQGQVMANQFPGLSLDRAWAMGYMQVAQQRGLITPEEFSAAQVAMVPPPPLPEVSYDEYDEEEIEAPEIVAPIFDGTAPATREEIASWLVTAMQSVRANIFQGAPAVAVSIQNFNDWNTISPNRANAVETVLRHNIMNGQTANIFGPNSSVPRQEMAQIVRNMDTLHLSLLGLERIVGTVTDTSNTQVVSPGSSTLSRNIHVRRSDGLRDWLQYTMPVDGSVQDSATDAVVLRNGNVMGLTGLQTGDQIEYFVHPETNTVWYVNVMGPAPTQTFRGRLQGIDVANGVLTFTDANGNASIFTMIDGMYGTRPDGEQFIRFGNLLRPTSSLPRGVYYDVTLVGNLVTGISFVGTAVITPEIRGIVIDNNPMLGSLTILDESRLERNFNYIPGHLMVQRREFFDMRDTVGGIHEMFPGFNPRETSINAVMPGDIVVFSVADDDPTRIVAISAVENVTTRYGRILEFRDHGGFFDMLMEFENRQTAWFAVPGNVLVMDRGRPTNAQQIQLGDWARITVNQAVLAPGVMMETVRDISLDSGGHHINSVVMGRIAGFHSAQNILQIEHAQELTPAGWSNHSHLRNVNIGGPNVRYYHDGVSVSFAHVTRYLQRSNATVYLAIEDHFAGERAVMVSIRSGRDELIQPATVLGTAQNGFHLLEIGGMIQTDPGTIVVRNNRLVEPNHIFAPDWARVSLNGFNTAAVVNIEPAPSHTGVQIVRGRIAQVMPNQSFRVETMSIFDGFRWNFTPIAREFVIDRDTIFIDESGAQTSIDQFIGFTEDSVIGEIFNVVVEGPRAARVIRAPFTEPIPQLVTSPGHLTIRGTIYAVAGDNISLRDVSEFNGRTGQWTRISNINATAQVNARGNTIVVNRDQVVGRHTLQVGQQILAFSDVRRDEIDIEPEMSADVFIILVEN